MSTLSVHRLMPVFLIFVLGFSGVSHAQSQILFSCRIPPTLPQWQMLFDAFSEALGAMGYSFEMHYLNGKRETYELRISGKYDGICIRRKSFAKEAEEYSMVLVDAVVGDPYTSVWKNKNVAAPVSPSRIFFENAKVGYLRGNGVAMEYLSQHSDINALTFLRPDLGVKTLVSGRIDYWVGYSHTVEFLAEQMNFYNTIEKVDDVRQDFFYPYLSRQHLHIKPQFEKQLNQVMSRRGSLIR